MQCFAGSQLNQQLNQWLSEASGSSHGPARAIISPHAGYSYCGSCAAHAYKQIDATNVYVSVLCFKIFYSKVFG